MTSVTAEGLSLTYQGALTVPVDGQLVLDGVAAIAARDATDAIALAGMTMGQGPAVAPLNGQVQVKYGAGKLSLETKDLNLAGAALSGSAVLVAVTKAGEGGAPVSRELDADLSIDTATLQGVLGAIADRRQEAGQGPRGVWPDRPVSFNGFEGLQGRIHMAVGTLGVEGPIALTTAKATIVLGANAISINDLTANGLGGVWAGKLTLNKAPAGVALTGELTLSEGDLAGLGTGAKGPVSLAVNLKSQGLSPSGLISALQGKGQAALGAGMIKGLGPAGVAATVDQVLVGKLATDKSDLQEAVREALAGSSLPYAARQVPFGIADGIA